MKRLIVLFIMIVVVVCMNAQYFGGQGFGSTGAASSQQGFGVQMNLGLDLAGKHEMSFDIPEYGISQTMKMDANTGVTPSFEFIKKGKGLGLAYQMSRNVVFEYDDYDETLEAGVGFIPFYGILKYNFPMQNGMALEPVLQLGYNLFTYDDKYASDVDEGDYYQHVDASGGYFAGIGLNWIIQDHMVVHLLSKSNHAALNVEEGDYAGYGYWETSDYDVDITHSQIDLGVGYRF